MHDANFETINKKLQALLANRGPAQRIRTKEELETAVNTLVETIQEVLDQEVPITKPSPFTKCWWTKELTELKHEQTRLSKLSYRYRGIRDHTVHAEFKSATNKLSNRINETKKEHWTEWLQSANS